MYVGFAWLKLVYVCSHVDSYRCPISFEEIEEWETAPHQQVWKYNTLQLHRIVLCVYIYIFCHTFRLHSTHTMSPVCVFPFRRSIRWRQHKWSVGCFLHLKIQSFDGNVEEKRKKNNSTTIWWEHQRLNKGFNLCCTQPQMIKKKNIMLIKMSSVNVCT